MWSLKSPLSYEMQNKTHARRKEKHFYGGEFNVLPTDKCKMLKNAILVFELLKCKKIILWAVYLKQLHEMPHAQTAFLKQRSRNDKLATHREMLHYNVNTIKKKRCFCTWSDMLNDNVHVLTRNQKKEFLIVILCIFLWENTVLLKMLSPNAV